MKNIMFIRLVLFLEKIILFENHSQLTTHNLQLKRGFTIIELLVVITMVGLVSGVGMISLVNYGNTQNVEQSVANIKAIFDEAKFNALSSVVRESDGNGNPIACTGNLSSYRVDIIPATGVEDSVELYMECGDSTSLVKTYTLPDNLNIGVDTTCDEVEYQVITLEASALPLLPCVVSIEGHGQIRSLTIDSIGNLNIE